MCVLFYVLFRPSMLSFSTEDIYLRLLHNLLTPLFSTCRIILPVPWKDLFLLWRNIDEVVRI